MPGIHSERVVLLEGNADEIVPNAKLASEMRGFVIMTPPGERSDWFLDMLWRITMLYAGMPSWLRSRARVTKMVEAVMSKENRGPSPARRPARKSGPADRAQQDDLTLSKLLLSPAPTPNAKLLRAIESLPPLRDEIKPRIRK